MSNNAFIKDFNDRLDRRDPKALAALRGLARNFRHGTPNQRYMAARSLASIVAHRKATRRRTITVSGAFPGGLGSALTKLKHVAIAPLSWTLHTSGKLLGGAGNVIQKAGAITANVLTKGTSLAARPFHASGTFLQKGHHLPTYRPVPRLGK